MVSVTEDVESEFGVGSELQRAPQRADRIFIAATLRVGGAKGDPPVGELWVEPDRVLCSCLRTSKARLGMFRKVRALIGEQRAEQCMSVGEACVEGNRLFQQPLSLMELLR